MKYLCTQECLPDVYAEPVVVDNGHCVHLKRKIIVYIKIYLSLFALKTRGA